MTDPDTNNIPYKQSDSNHERCEFSGGLLNDEEIEVKSRVLKAVAHPVRLKILCILGQSEVNVQDIVKCIGSSQSNISQHLSVMRDKNILATTKVANRVYYRIKDETILTWVGITKQQRIAKAN